VVRAVITLFKYYNSHSIFFDIFERSHLGRGLML